MRIMALKVATVVGLGFGMAGTVLACGLVAPGYSAPPYFGPGCGRPWPVYPSCHGTCHTIPYGYSPYGAGYAATAISPPSEVPVAAPAPQAPPVPPPPQLPSPSLTGTAASQPIAKTDKFNGQRTCPVTGEELGAMGTPIPVTVNGQVIYVCCQSCVAKVKKNPDQFLDKVAAERRGSAMPPDGNLPAHHSPGGDEQNPGD